MTNYGNAENYNNSLTEAQFNALIQMGCLFISATDYYYSGWAARTTWFRYWSNTYYSDTCFYPLQFQAGTNSVTVTTRPSNCLNYYLVVKLVKSIVD